MGACSPNGFYMGILALQCTAVCFLFFNGYLIDLYFNIYFIL